MYLCFEADSVRRDERDFDYTVKVAKELGFKSPDCLDPGHRTGSPASSIPNS